MEPTWAPGVCCREERGGDEVTIWPASYTDGDPLLNKGCVLVAEWSCFAESPLSLKPGLLPQCWHYKRRNIGFVSYHHFILASSGLQEALGSTAGLLGL